MSENNSSGGGVGFLGLLTIMFIGLKLGHVIDWPWLWVLAPAWIPLAIWGTIAFIALMAYALAKAWER